MKWLFLLILFGNSLLFAKPKIVVIGAGLSGLTCAWRLHQEGFDVEVYEAKNRVGGRVFSVFLNGEIVELGAQNLKDGGESKNILALIDELGLETEELTIPSEMHFLHDDEVKKYNELIDLCPKERLRERLKEIAARSKNMKEILDEVLGQENPLYTLIQARLEAYEGGSIEKLSPFYAETLYHQLSGGICSAHPATEEMTIEFEWVKGGNGLIAERLSEKLDQKVHLNMPLRRISKTDRFHLTFNDGTIVSSDIVILSIPCPAYKNLVIGEDVLPLEKKAQIASIENGENAKVIVPLPHDVVPITSTNGRLIAFRNSSGRAIVLFYLGKPSHFNRKTVQSIFNEDLPFLEKVYKIKKRKVVVARDQSFVNYTTAVGYSWPEDPFVGGSYAFIAAGQEELFTSTTKVEGIEVKKLFAPHNSLYFAGEHTSTLFDVTGTMEAAVESGEKTASLIIAKEAL